MSETTCSNGCHKFFPHERNWFTDLGAKDDYWEGPMEPDRRTYCFPSREELRMENGQPVVVPMAEMSVAVILARQVSEMTGTCPADQFDGPCCFAAEVQASNGEACHNDEDGCCWLAWAERETTKTEETSE